MIAPADTRHIAPGIGRPPPSQNRSPCYLRCTQILPGQGKLFFAQQSDARRQVAEVSRKVIAASAHTEALLSWRLTGTQRRDHRRLLPPGGREDSPPTNITV